MSLNIKLNEPMKKHTSFRVGGTADVFFTPQNLPDLVKFLKTETPKAIFWLGLGSNVLVRDGGIRGTVIAPKLTKLELTKTNTIYAEAWVSCAKLSRFAYKQGFEGMEFLSGIPGTVGGALAMNAGAFGNETWQQINSVTTINIAGEVQKLTPADFKINYRQATAKHSKNTWFVAGEFISNNKAKTENIKALLNKRNLNQPIGLPSCGSVFKNPPNNYSAKLIENAGLKGFCIGEACVSEKHANFIINTGNTTSTDIESLIFHIQSTVLEKFSIKLELEVRIIGQES